MRKKFHVLIPLLLLCTLLISCNKKDDKNSIKNKEKAPKDLVIVAENLDGIFNMANEIEEMLELSSWEFETLNSEEKGTDTEGEKEEGENNEDNNQELKSQDLDLRDRELFKKWYNMDRQIEKLHREWNSYEAEGIEKGKNNPKFKEFKANLDVCTLAIESRDIGRIRDSGSRLYLSLGSFFDLYKDEIRGDLYRIKYVAYQVNLIGETNRDEAKQLLESTGEYIARIKSKLSNHKDRLDKLDKLSLSIEDMMESLDMDNKRLLDIKRDIIIYNAKQLEKLN